MQLPKVYGPDLPIPMTDDAEDIRMEIEARYELATEQLRKLNFFTRKQKTKGWVGKKRKELEGFVSTLKAST